MLKIQPEVIIKNISIIPLFLAQTSPCNQVNFLNTSYPSTPLENLRELLNSKYHNHIFNCDLHFLYETYYNEEKNTQN